MTTESIRKPEDRAKLAPRGRPYSEEIERGLRLGYRRLDNGAGTWVALIADGNRHQQQRRIGSDADFDYKAALAEAIKLGDAKLEAAAETKKPQTIGQALTAYGERLFVQGKKVSTAGWLRGLFGPERLGRSLAQVTPKELQAWQGVLLAAGKAETTINKAIGQLKPAFKWAAANDPRIAANASAWEEGFTRYKGAKVKVARKIRLTDDQVRAAVAHAHGTSKEWGLFVQMHADFGTRTSQLARITVDQLRQDNRLEIPGDKKGNGSRNPRSFKVGLALLEKLRSAAAGQPSGAILLRDEFGQPWLRELPGKNEMVGERHYRLFSKLASELAFPTEMRRGKVCETTLYALRAASIARLIKARRPIKEIADIHFTSIAEIEQHYHRDVAHDDAALVFDSSPIEAKILQMPVGKAA